MLGSGQGEKANLQTAKYGLRLVKDKPGHVEYCTGDGGDDAMLISLSLA
jgi:hypothetical protein